LYNSDDEFALQTHYCGEPAAAVPLLIGCRPWHPLNMSLLLANSLLRGTTAIHGSSELTSVSKFAREFFAKQKNIATV